MEEQFIIHNISDMNVGLADLALIVPKGSTYNLFDKNFNLTKLQVKESAQKGSLFKKRDKIITANVFIEVDDDFVLAVSWDYEEKR